MQVDASLIGSATESPSVEATITGVESSSSAMVDLEARVGGKTVLRGKALALIAEEGAAPLSA